MHGLRDGPMKVPAFPPLSSFPPLDPRPRNGRRRKHIASQRKNPFRSLPRLDKRGGTAYRKRSFSQ